MGLAADLDRTQRRVPVLGFPLAVFYKYFDDQGNYLSAIITYYAFIAIFPLLLLSTSILGFVLQNDTSLAQRLLSSALSQFPIVGDELGRPGGLKGSYGGVVVGGLAALYGSLGLGQALQNAMNVAWSVPRNKRPNPVRVRVRSLALLVLGGASVLVITTVSTIGTDTEVFGSGLDDSIRWLIRLATIVLLGGVLTLIFRLAAARRHHLGRAAPGAFVVAVLWQTLQYLGTVYVEHVIGETSGVNKTFALVLGLLGIIYAAAIMGVLGMQVNVVLARRLWPRSLGAVFFDNEDLTEADLRAYAGYIRSQRHKQIENVEITFVDPATGEIRIPQEAQRKADAKLRSDAGRTVRRPTPPPRVPPRARKPPRPDPVPAPPPGPDLYAGPAAADGAGRAPVEPPPDTVPILRARRRRKAAATADVPPAAADDEQPSGARADDQPASAG